MRRGQHRAGARVLVSHRGPDRASSCLLRSAWRFSARSDRRRALLRRRPGEQHPAGSSGGTGRRHHLGVARRTPRGRAAAAAVLVGSRVRGVRDCATPPVPRRSRSRPPTRHRARASKWFTAAFGRNLVQLPIPRHPPHLPPRRPGLRRDPAVFGGAAMTLLRRAITVPLMTLLMIGVLVVWPLLLAIGGVAGLMARSSLPVRSLGVVMAYALLELRALWKLLLGDASASPEQIPREAPLLVLSRHCGPGDTLLVAWLLNIHYRLRLRIVLRALLRCEPVLDLAGDLGCLCFLHRRSEKARKQIHDMAASLTGGQALLLFPEGGNFTWARWRNAVVRLRSSGKLREARRAWRQSHTLPPRIGGTATALAGAPGAHVLVLTHTGFSPDGRARAWWRLPMNRRLLVRTVLVPAAQLPPPDQLGPWLEQTWGQVDAWVAGHTDQPQ